MAPQMVNGGYIGKQPETAHDPASPTHETCWIWKPSAGTEHWILYRGPSADHPYVDPGPLATDVWLRIERLGDAGSFANLVAFVTWVLDRLASQGRANAATDVELLTHAIS
jgi:hypothetical protein